MADQWKWLEMSNVTFEILSLVTWTNCCQELIHTCVPGVVTASPWQCRTEGKAQVQQSPGQNDNITHGAVDQDQLTSIANACQVISNR